MFNTQYPNHANLRCIIAKLTGSRRFTSFLSPWTYGYTGSLTTFTFLY